MRTISYILMLGVAIAFVAPAAPAAASSSGPTAAPTFELVTGTGTIGQFGDPTVQANVFAFGTTPIGETVISYPDGTFVSGRATCLFVAGQTAYITSQIVRSRGPRVQSAQFLPGNFVVIGIQAEAPRSTAPDMLNFSSGYAVNPGCGPFEVVTPTNIPVVRGDFHVFGPPTLSPGI
jgi:hypothetical protein